MARTTGAMKHIHKYYKMEYTGLWYCGADNCTHFMPGNMPAPNGRLSKCWACDKTFQLAPYNMRDTHPECDECMERHAIMEATLDDVGIDPMFIGMSPAMIEKTKAAIERNKIAREEEELTRAGAIDEIEVIDPEHTSDCEIYQGLLCTCGVASQD